MRFFLIPSVLFLLLSCGEVPVEEGAGVRLGQEITVDNDDVLTSNEKSTLNDTCNSLLNKELLFQRTIVRTGQLLKFSVQSKSCSGSYGPKNFFSSKVEETTNGLRLMTVGSEGLPELLTEKSYLLKNFCQQSTSNSDIQRAEVFGNSATRLDLQKGGEGQCGRDKRDICLFFSTGNKTQNSNKYVVKDIQRFRIRVDNQSNSDGVVLNQSMESSQFCTNREEFKVIEQANLDFR